MTTESQNQSLLTIALMAAFADGDKADAEREAIQKMAETLAQGKSALELSGLVQDVLLQRVSVDKAVASLNSPGQRQLAYEMAVSVCEADGRQTRGEAAFLADLKARLGLSAADTQAFEAEAEALVTATESMAGPSGAMVSSTSSTPSTVNNDELDRQLLKAATVNGALELLPQSWASMAIIPLQVRLVYQIGQAHGVQLDQGHIREFIAAVGVGVTSQYLEQFGRKLIGGLLGKVAGGLIGGLGRAGTGAAFSFATTYALGQVAKRYYAGGRMMSTALLQSTFQDMLGQAKQLQAQHLPQIQEASRSLNMNQVLRMVRGQ